MFAMLARVATRYRYPIILFWIVLTVGITLVAPALDDVASDDNRRFLPDDSLALEGQAALDRYFPHLSESANVVLVFDAGEDGSVNSPENSAFIAEISQWLVGEDAPAGISAVTSPALVPEAAALLVSPDERVGAVVVSMAPGLPEDGQLAILDEVRARLDAAPDGLATYRTGQLSTNLEYTAAIQDSVGSTAIVTIMLVTVILLTIFRSPVSPFIPLSIVTIALLVTQGVVALLGQEVMDVSSIASVLLIVVIYGAGTDYCLFLISRFREEMGHGYAAQPAAGNTVQRVGESIFNSAATTTTGFMAMALTQFGLFNTTGPILAIAIVITLAAALTLTPAVLSLLGGRTFWPAKVAETGRSRQQSRLFAGLAALTRRYRYPIAAGLIILLASLAAYGVGYEMTFNFLDDMPAEAESVEGLAIAEAAIGPGELQPVTVMARVETDDLYAESARLAALMVEHEGVADVRGATQPLGAGHPPVDNPTEEMMAISRGYLNPAENIIRFDVVLVDGPYTSAAMDTLEDIEGQLEDQSSAHFMTGATVTTLDLRRIMASDLRLTIGLVLGGIFIILVIMLRSLVAPLYLIGTIVLSFGATLGLTRLVTGPLFGEERLVFWVPFMMFVFLVALGIDYSIFLFSRIKEEMGRGGAMQPAVVRSVGMTGAIITSAGVIVAGSFIALTTGDIIGLQQVGFAVGAGILIDTVVIRTVLVPAIALMVGRWSWWPGGLFRAGQPDAVQPRPERVTVP